MIGVGCRVHDHPVLSLLYGGGHASAAGQSFQLSFPVFFSDGCMEITLALPDANFFFRCRLVHSVCVHVRRQSRGKIEDAVNDGRLKH